MAGDIEPARLAEMPRSDDAHRGSLRNRDPVDRVDDERAHHPGLESRRA